MRPDAADLTIARRHLLSCGVFCRAAFRRRPHVRARVGQRPGRGSSGTARLPRVHHPSRYPLRHAGRRDLCGRPRGWMRVGGAVVPARAGTTAPSTRKPGRASRGSAHHGPLLHHHARRHHRTRARNVVPWH